MLKHGAVCGGCVGSELQVSIRCSMVQPFLSLASGSTEDFISPLLPLVLLKSSQTPQTCIVGDLFTSSLVGLVCLVYRE